MSFYTNKFFGNFYGNWGDTIKKINWILLFKNIILTKAFWKLNKLFIAIYLTLLLLIYNILYEKVVTLFRYRHNLYKGSNCNLKDEGRTPFLNVNYLQSWGPFLSTIVTIFKLLNHSHESVRTIMKTFNLK